MDMKLCLLTLEPTPPPQLMVGQAEEFILNIISLKKEPMGIIKLGSNVIRTVYLKY